METVSSAPTIKQRRKFECIETSHLDNQDTSSVNHTSDVSTINKLSKYVQEEIQTLADCCKESVKMCLSQEENSYQRKHNDSVSYSSTQENYLQINKAILYGIVVSPFIISMIAFPTTYYLCRSASHAESIFLYVSDTAIEYPESSIAAQCLNMIGITVCLSLFIRFLLLNQYFQDGGQKRIPKRYVYVPFWCALGALLSVQVIGNFPAVDTGTLSIHFVSAITFITCVIIYMIYEISITRATIDILCDRRIYYLRTSLAVLMLLSASAAFVAGPISWKQYDGENYRNWKSSNGGWICHVISVVGEWLFIVFATFYVSTFVYEVRMLTIYMPVIKIRYLSVKEKTES